MLCQNGVSASILRGVRVMSVYPAQSKSDYNCNCFRVCVNADDLSIFCNPVNWPENVSVREWVFKQTNVADKAVVDKAGQMSTSDPPETKPEEATSDSTEIVITADVHQQSAIWSDEITELESTSMS